MAKQQFKAESKRLLDMMINSIYTHKEIFLRELISNASDAIDKRHFRSLTDSSLVPEGGYEIRLTADKDARTLTISDNGIGMTQEELENNLGVIAQSGSLAFKKENQSEDTDIIGMVRENGMTMEQFAELFRRMQAAPAPATSEKEALNHD